MIALCCFVESRTSCGRQIDISPMWHLIREFGGDELLVIDYTNFECFDPERGADVPISRFYSLAEAVAARPDPRWVFLEKDVPNGAVAISLPDYQHPKDAIYVVGADARGIVGATAEMGDWVKVPVASKYPLWAAQAATIVMWDRWNRGNH